MKKSTQTKVLIEGKIYPKPSAPRPEPPTGHKPPKLVK